MLLAKQSIVLGPSPFCCNVCNKKAKTIFDKRFFFAHTRNRGEEGGGVQR